MVGKGDCGKDRPQRLCAHSPRDHPAEIREGQAIEIIGAETIEGHQHEGRLRKVLGTIDATASR
jgi:hypothetical protein